MKDNILELLYATFVLHGLTLLQNCFGKIVRNSRQNGQINYNFKPIFLHTKYWESPVLGNMLCLLGKPI